MIDRLSVSAVRGDAARRLLRCAGILFALLLVSQLIFSMRAPDAMAAKSVQWNQFDVAIKLLSDGQLSVTETQVIDFEDGPFTAGSRNIPIGKVDGITNVRISEIVDGQKLPYKEVSSFNREPGTFAVAQTASELLINWGFSSTTDAIRTFEITYLVQGAVRNYPNEDPANQQIWWTAVSSELTNTAPVLESTTSITLTQAVDPADVIAGTENLPIEPTTTDNQTWTWHATDLKDGEDLTVRLQFPPLVNVATPSWQQQDDEQRAQSQSNEQRDQLYNLGFLALGVLGAIVGGISLYGLWYTKGRDPQVGPVASFLAEPPGDLPPGAVGVLLDETADQRDVVATMVDLGNRGIIELSENDKTEGFLGLGSSSDYDITLKQVPENLRPFETTLLVALFGSELEVGKKVKMSDVGGRFQGSSERIKNQLVDELVERKYFDAEPDSVRKRYRSAGYGALVLAVVLGCIGISFIGTSAPLIWLPLIVLFVLAIILIVMSSSMPRKTQLGSEEAAKYRAFRTYLKDIDKYENIEAKNTIFEKYLPYAIAFGLEEDYTKKFAQAGSATPSWYEPMPGQGGSYSGGRRRGSMGPVIIWGNSPFGGGTSGGFGGSTGGGGGSHGGGGGLPDLQDMSDSAAKGLGSSSNSLFGMLTAAAAAFGASAASGSGGGRSFGGGGGFGGGFSGGGGFGGGGGSGGGGGGFS